MTTIPADDMFFSKTEEGKPDVEFLKRHFYLEGQINEEHALYIIDKATQLLRAEPNVLTVDGPVIGAPRSRFIRLFSDRFVQSAVTSTVNT